MNLENYFISLFNNKHIGDDASVIGNYAYSKDAFFEDVHFKRAWMSSYEIARKAMLINISDAIAMNATPKYALLCVAMPKHFTKQDMRDLATGFKDVATEYKIEIIGGDTIANSKLDITVTIVSQVKKPLLRAGIKKHYLLAYTGDLGKSAKDLKKLLNLGKIHQKSKFISITLRENFVKKSSRFLKAGMDISDGLFSDLEKLTDKNNIGIKFLYQIDKRVGCSGEEYELLVAFDRRDKKAIMRRAKQSRTALNIFAKVARNRYKNDRCKAHHF